MKNSFLLASMIVLVVGARGADAAENLNQIAKRFEEAYRENLNQIAKRFEEAYQDARFIHIEGTSTTATGDRLEYIYKGKRDSFRTICYNGGQVYGAFSLHEGRVQEYVPEHPQRLLLSYDAKREVSIPSLVYGRELDCLYGNLFEVWIGEKAPQWSLIGERIREGRLRGSQSVGDRTCHVVEWTTEARDGTTTQSFTFLYYIDAETFVLRRMDRTHLLTRDETAVVDDNWTLIYHTMELSEEPQAIGWDIWGIVSEVEAEKCDGVVVESP